MESVQSVLSPRTVQWFTETLGTPTPVQALAWPAILKGEHVLVSAPTGTGKTLAAFLVFLDQLYEKAMQGTLEDALTLIYVSPLKSLATDIRENLTRPLNGIHASMLRVGIRTGDTTPAERQRMLRHPPHILITTPESLYILLCTEKGRRMLSTARAIILDELHALISTKRGAHLMLSLARLDALASQPLQRIGLSATLQPLSLAAEYLAPAAPVTIIAPDASKTFSMTVNGILPDMRKLPQGTIWPELAAKVVDACEGKRTVIAFLEGRAQAERLAAEVNRIAGDGFALTHHGSVSREKRQEAEAALRSGKLRLLCATSSMELGIDVGEIDLVLQIGCPLSVSSALQRMGRAGHRPDSSSDMRIFPKTASDGLACALTASAAADGLLEPARPPEGCLDVLAQHLVSMAGDSCYTVDDAVSLAHAAWPTMHLNREDILALLRMLSGDWEHAQDKPVRPRLLFDRIHGRIQGDGYTRLLALSAGGTIPDRGLYPAVLSDGTRIGELDEEFVFEARLGDRFLLGTFAWRIEEIRRDRVLVSPVSATGAQAPFWRGDGLGRDYGISRYFGQKLHCLQSSQNPERMLRTMHMDAWAAQNTARYIADQLAATGCLPDDHTLIAEHFCDEAGEHQLMIHSIFGRTVNDGLALLLQHAATEQTGMEVRVWNDDQGILLYAIGSQPIPDGLLTAVDPLQAEAILQAIMPSTPLFSMLYRYNAARALMMGARSGKRQPLWVQRLRSAESLSIAVHDLQHPLIRETLKECLESRLNISAIKEVLAQVRAGIIAVRELHRDVPSPMALPMRRQAEAEMMYDYAPIPRSARESTENALKQLKSAAEGIRPDPGVLQSVHATVRTPDGPEQLHSLLMRDGDFQAGEVDVPLAWIQTLIRSERCLYIEPGLWIAAEHEEDYRLASSGDTDKRMYILRRCLHSRGPQDSVSLHARYGWPEPQCDALLRKACDDGICVHEDGLYFHTGLYQRAQRLTIQAQRNAVVTLPAECYASMCARKLRVPGPSDTQLKEAIDQLLNQPYPVSQWEGLLLPARVHEYQPDRLDALIAQGDYFWKLEHNMLSFHRTDDLDWTQVPEWDAASVPDTDCQAVLKALSQRGASFAPALTGLTRRPVTDVLLELASLGLVCADSFIPLRILQALEPRTRKNTRQLARLRAMGMHSGRWSLVLPLKEKTDEERLTDAFHEQPLLCRETLHGLSWAAALDILRLWEYTGKVRRGYFVAGLSGIQFIRSEDYPVVMSALQSSDTAMVWLHANDPLQAWGNPLAQPEGCSIVRIPASAVCLLGGRPVALLEQHGRKLTILRKDLTKEILDTLTHAFLQKHLFAQQDRLTLKQYPEYCAQYLSGSEWHHEMLDWVLWR